MEQKPHRFKFERRGSNWFAVSVQNSSLRVKIEDRLYQFVTNPSNSSLRTNEEIRAALAVALFGEDTFTNRKKAGNRIERFTWGMAQYNGLVSLFCGTFIDGVRYWRVLEESEEPQKIMGKREPQGHALSIN